VKNNRECQELHICYHKYGIDVMTIWLPSKRVVREVIFERGNILLYDFGRYRYAYYYYGNSDWNRPSAIVEPNWKRIA